MSYGLRYTLTFRDEVSSNTLYKINIYKNGYSGSSSAMTCSDNPISLSYKKQDLISSIMGSELTIGIISVTNFQYIEFLTAAPLQYYADVLISANNGTSYTTYWSGVNTTDCYTEPWNNAPYNINLKFNCGLGELQWHRYENTSSLISGVEQIIAIISNCLSFLPYVKNVREIINIREDTMDDTKGLFEQLYLMDIGFTEVADDGILHGINCNKLLNQILMSLNCRMYQSNNMWYVERIWERTTTSMTYFDYTPTGVIQNPPYTYANIGTGSFDPRINIDNDGQPKLLDGGDLAVTTKQPSLAYSFSGGSIDNVELLANSYFENTPTSVNGSGQPINWDIGTNLAANCPCKIEVVNPYTTDLKRRWGMSLGAAIPAFNSYVLGKMTSYPFPMLEYAQFFQETYFPLSWAAHSVRRPGDSYSNPSVYIDVVNGSLEFDLEFMVNFRLTVNTAQTWSQWYLGDADKVINNTDCALYTPFIVKFIDSASNGYNLATTQGSGTFYENEYFVGQFLWSFQGLNISFPSVQFSGSPVPLTPGTLATLLAPLTAGQHLDINFNIAQTFTVPLTAPFTVNGIYDFDVKIFPPIVFGVSGKPGIYGTGYNHITFALNDYAVNVADFQYQDSYTQSSSYVNFYSSSDNSIRWNEKKVTVVFGDTLTPGYPGSFRISNGSPTTSWHLRTASKKYTFDSGTSNADPGSGKLRFNNATLSAVSHIYIDDTDANSINEASWIGAMASGQTLVISDSTSGAQVTFTLGSIASHSGYYDIPVTFVSGKGSFSASDSLFIVYEAGNILADMLFQKYESLIAVYRRALTGKVLINGGIPFWNNIVDEDGTMYAQTGNQFDFKKAMLTINMEEVSAAPATIGITKSGVSIVGVVNRVPTAPFAIPPPPALILSKTALSKIVSMPSSPPSYPVA